ASGALVVKRKGEHASKLLNAISAVLFVEMNDDFGVGVRGKAMAAGFQVRTKLLEIVDLAVVDDPNGFIFVEDGLVPAGQIDDAQTAHAQSNAGLYEDPFIIRTPVHNGLTHPVNRGGVHHSVRMSLHHSGNATHS